MSSPDREVAHRGDLDVPAEADTVRCFVALPVPGHVRTLVAAARAPAVAAAGDLTWTRPDGWHVTLAFLGDVPVDAIEDVAAVVAAVCRDHAPLRLSLGPAGRFGGRALWLRIEDAPAGGVAALGADLQDALATAGLPVQRRQVRAHLTLARGGRGRRRQVDDAVVAAVAPVAATWDADQVALYRAVLGGGPARYASLATAPLGPSSS